MKKKLLAGILALALCSTNMPPQTIFAGEFTSGNPDVVSEEETPEIFTNEEQEAAGETDEELSVFSSEEIPEFNDTPDEAMAAAENAQIEEIDLINSAEINNGVYTITSAGDYKFTCSSQETPNRIVVDGKNISAEANINIYLDNVNIKTSADPALQIQSSVQAQVYIYLKGNNKFTLLRGTAAALQKDNTANLVIDNARNTTGNLIVEGCYAGAGIGSGKDGVCSNIRISGGSVTATSDYGAGIGSGKDGGTCSDIGISDGSVTATSRFGAGIGSGKDRGTCSNIAISGGSVTATSRYGAGIGSGEGGGNCSDIAISGGSVNVTKFGCPPRKNLNSTGENPEVYRCTISNPQKGKISIDNNDWITYNHVTGTNVDDNLYAWLPGESHTITVGNDKRTYSFDNNQFIRKITNPTADQFAFTQSNFIYNKDNSVDISKYIKWKEDVTGYGNITNVKYFNETGTLLTNSPIDAGTYTFNYK